MDSVRSISSSTPSVAWPQPAGGTPPLASTAALAPAPQAEASPFGLFRGTTGRWVSDFYVGTCRIRRSTGTRDYAEAVGICARWKAVGIDALPRPRTLQHSVQDLVDLIEHEHGIGRVSPGTRRLYLDRLDFLRTWLVTTLGGEPALHRLDTALITRYIRWRESTPITRNGRPQGERHLPSKRTVVHDLDTFRAIFRRAIKLGWMTTEPTQAIQRDRKAYRPRISALEGGQLRAFLAELRTRGGAAGTATSGLRLVPDFCEATFICGLRREETRTLTKADVDLRRNVVHVRQKTLQLTVVLAMSATEYQAMRDAVDAGRRPRRPRPPEYIPTEALRTAVWHPDREALVIKVAHVWRPKGGGREREIPLSAKARSYFAGLMGRTLDSWYPDSSLTGLRADLGLPMPDLLFPGAEGGLLRSNMNREVVQAAVKAGIGPIRIHDLRHVFATQMRAAGVELSTIQSLLGHEDIQTTQMYAHYTDREGRAAVGSLEW